MNCVLLVDADEQRAARFTASLRRRGFETLVVMELTLLAKAAAGSVAAVLDTDIVGVSARARAFFTHFVRGLILFRPELPLITIASEPNPDVFVAMAELNVDWHFTEEPDAAVLAAQVDRVAGDGGAPQGQPAPARGLVLDIPESVAHYQGESVRLSARELSLLRLLIQEPGRVYSRDEIIKALRPHALVTNERSVDVIMSRLRSKFARSVHASAAANLRTVTGVGYAYTPAAVPGSEGSR